MNDFAPLTLHTIVRQGSRHVSADMGGTTALMSIENGKYYCLNETSSCIWELLQHPLPLAHVCHSLQTEFDISATECESAVISHVEELVRQKLVDIVNAKAD